MSDACLITLLGFGALRAYTAMSDGPMTVSVPVGASYDELKNFISAEIVKQHPDCSITETLNSCALAHELDILPSTFICTRAMTISVLPPVCGG